MRLDSQAKSLHYVQLYAVKDRIPLSHLSPVPPSVSEINLSVVLPSDDDIKTLLDNLTILIARIMVKRILYFSEDFKTLLPTHIQHKYSSQMAKKSEVVPLGVLPKNEMYHADMIDIIEHAQTYIPVQQVTKVLSVPGEDSIHMEDQNYWITIFGGDLLSVVRARGAQRIRSNSATKEAKLDSVLPVAEDWHGKQCFMEVIWKRLYKTTSAIERGTLFNLRNQLNRRNVSKNCKKDLNAHEDFLEGIVETYVVTAVMEYLKMDSISDVPSKKKKK